MNTLTSDIFIKNSIKKHGIFYDYSDVKYINSHTLVSIICPFHGKFKQTANSHLNGNGCPKCGINKSAHKKRKSLQKFIITADKIHNKKYDYSKVIYKNTNTHIIIICPKHGKFLQRPDHHLRGSGCGKCAGVKLLTTNEFKEKAIKLHGTKYDYSHVIYINSLTPITIICPKHGKFLQKPTQHLKPRGCPSCKESRGELQIKQYLENNSFLFNREYVFPNCKDKLFLPFDFYIPSLNLCIEFDGVQHFKPLGYYGGIKKLKDTRKKDKIKNNYCKLHNINLIRIAYNENIHKKLNKLLPLYVK